MRPEIKKLADWLDTTADQMPFGELGIRIVLHDGNVSRTERSLVEKIKPDGQTRGENATSYNHR